MRPIRFRGKKFNNEWAYGSLIIDKYERSDGEVFDVAFIAKNLPCDEQSDDMWVAKMKRVKVDTICQFTGLHDKDGKDIYEGDIVECVSWNEYFSKDGQPMEPFRRKMYVDFRKGAFVMVEPMPEPLQDHECPIIYNGDITIIGNRFDNPGLIANKSLVNQ